jgi:hypothetical protein
MNRPTIHDNVRTLTVMSDGMGINAACRVSGASKNTVLKLLADVSSACALPHASDDAGHQDHLGSGR